MCNCNVVQAFTAYFKVRTKNVCGVLTDDSNILVQFLLELKYIGIYSFKYNQQDATFFFLLALQPPTGVVFYSPLAGFSLLAYEIS